jgi:DNA/RNA-binding domain of Phe-tRNA-synthetase-like protein
MLDVSLHLPVRLAVIAFDDVQVTRDETVMEPFEACAGRYHAAYAARGVTAPGGVEGVEVARDLFHALGIDPTRHRPCSEALLNRALKGKPQPHVNSLVDVGNWCALDFLLPLGIYDRASLGGRVVLRQGAAGETYEAINHREINLEGRYVLADDEGPFGSPITDSQRTAVSEATTKAVVIMYAPPSFGHERLVAAADELAARVTSFCGGATVQNQVSGGAIGTSRAAGVDPT